MTRSSLAVCATLAATTALVGARQEPQFRAATDVVSVYATVLDRDGRLATDLTQDDFEIYDNGKLQAVSMFTNDLQPITIVIMLDRSGSVEANLGLIQDAAEELVINLLPEDQARIGTFGRRIQIQPARFTRDQNELIRILHGNLQAGGPTPLWDAAVSAMNALAREDGRRVVLIFTDGKDSPDNLSAGTNFKDVRERAEREGIMVYGIGLSTDCENLRVPDANIFDGVRFQRRGGGRGGGRIRFPPIGGGRIGLPRPPGTRGLPRPTPGRPPYVPTNRCRPSKPDPDLRELAAHGGGGYFELDRTDDLGQTFAQVAEELHHQYLLAFAAPVRDGKMHKLEVKVRGQDMTVRARQSYLAPAR